MSAERLQALLAERSRIMTHFESLEASNTELDERVPEIDEEIAAALPALLEANANLRGHVESLNQVADGRAVQLTAMAAKLATAEAEAARLRAENEGLRAIHRHATCCCTTCCEAHNALAKVSVPAPPAAPLKPSEAALRARMDGTPFPLPDVLRTLADAAEVLLTEHNYDRHGHEVIGYAINAARAAATPEGSEATEMADAVTDAEEIADYLATPECTATAHAPHCRHYGKPAVQDAVGETYIEKLERWFAKARANGLVDMKFFPREPEDGPFDLEATAKAIYETVTGVRKSSVIATDKL